MARNRRRLRPEERELWERVAKQATPMHPERPRPSVMEGQTRAERPEPGPGEAPLPPFRIGSRGGGKATEHDLAPTISAQLSRQPVQMDAKAFGRLKRGRLAPEGRLDLHGMTLAQAHPALVGFVMNAHARGKRLLLVITGKGKSGEDTGPIPERRGVLKRQVPQWLRSAPLNSVVLQVSQAHRKHGGSGAYYVYLRRQR